MAMKIQLQDNFNPSEETWQKIEEAVENGLSSFTILSNGSIINSDNELKVWFGPVVGEVTESSANIVIETSCASESCFPLKCQLFAKNNDDNDDQDEYHPIQEMEQDVTSRRPHAFKFENLIPDTHYTVWFSTTPSPTMASFKTKKENFDNFRLIALSCDRPSRLLLGQLNPWKFIARAIRTKDVDTVLHLGDQIYPDDENIPNAAKIFAKTYDDLDESKQEDMMNRGRELWREKYRSNFNMDFKKDISAAVSNLMIWSDNDVANDFTTLKSENGEQAYHSKFLKCGMEVYREYQRKLWDPDCEPELPDNGIKEWHSHVYGNGKIGIFLFDLRGNRITPEGEQMSENSLLSDEQWQDFQDFMANPDLRAVILCSETPFLGEEPSVCKDKVECSSKMDFLKDHWYYNENELLKLVELCFDWKSQGEGMRDLIFIGGDIHCGVTTVLTDEESGLQINHFTTSPVTNHVCEFFPPLSGTLNERFHFNHLPLGRNFRNYLDVDVRFYEESTDIQARLVPVSTDLFKNKEFIP